MPLAVQQQQSEGWRVGTAPHPTLHPSPGTPTHPVPTGVPALTCSFAAGLKRIHVLTVQGSYELRIDLEDFDNGTAFAHYGSFGVGLFSVDPEEDGYPISIADYSGTAGRAAGWGDTHGPLGQGGSRSSNPLAGASTIFSGSGTVPAASLQPRAASSRRWAVVGCLQGG